MDVGRFVRRRTELWAWILGPVMVIWLAHAGVLLYHLMAASTLAGLKAHRDIVPQMLAIRQTVEAQLADFRQVVDSEGEAMAAITRILDGAESESGFAVNSVRREDPGKVRKGVSAIQVSVIGSGQLHDIIRFLDRVQQPRHLVDVVRADLNVMQGPVYSAKFELRYYAIDESDAKTSRQARKGVDAAG
jgi:hypothetical protein